jgi:hypothetical protein
MPGTQMPHYLTVPEPVSDDVHWAKRLVTELFRAIFKAAGHQTASFFDSNPIRKHK